MKKRFFKKLKKYIFVLSCVLCCLILLSIPVSAAGVSDFVDSDDITFYASTFAVPGVSGAASSGVNLIPDTPLLTFLSEANSYPYEIIGETTTNFYRNANYIQDRLGFLSKSNSVIIDKNSTFDGYLTGFSSRWIVKYNGNYGFIYLNADVALQLVIMFRDKNGSYHNVTVDDFHYEANYLRFKCLSVPVDATGFLLNIVYKPSDSDLIDERTGYNLDYYIENGLVGNHQFWFTEFNTSFNSTRLPASEQPIYSGPSSAAQDSASRLEGLESQATQQFDSVTSETNVINGMVLDFLGQYAPSLSAGRNMFNYFFSNKYVAGIAFTVMVVGFILLFSNLIPRKKDK